eukprot:845965-Lingulodinium_polyedra.AAC.1
MLACVLRSLDQDPRPVCSEDSSEFNVSDSPSDQVGPDASQRANVVKFDFPTCGHLARGPPSAAKPPRARMQRARPLVFVARLERQPAGRPGLRWWCC